MNHILTAEKAKNQAKLLATYLAGIKRKVTHGNALEAVAAMYGKNSWNVLSSELESAVEEAPVEGATASIAAKPVYVVNGNAVEVFIDANVHTDDYRCDVDFDATPWFVQATDKQILGLAGIEWRGDYEADAVAEYIRDQRLDPDVSELFGYHEAANDALSNFDDPIGFEVRVDEADALKYLKAFRYPLFVRLMLQEAYESNERPTVSEDSDQPGLWAFKAMGDGSDISYSSEAEAYAALGRFLEKRDETFAHYCENQHQLGAVEAASGTVPSSGTKKPVTKVKGRSDDDTGAVLLLEGEPLSVEALREITADCEFYLQVALKVSVDDLVEMGIDGLNDHAEEMILSEGILSNLTFEWPNAAQLAAMGIPDGSGIVVVTAGWDYDGFGNDDSDNDDFED